MPFMMLVKANRDSEAGIMPDEVLIAAMGNYNEELQAAGVSRDLSDLQPSSKGARVVFSGGKATVVEGPFADAKDLIAGYWIVEVKSKAEAIAWAKRAPAPHGKNGGEIEIRQFFELDDFPPSPAVDQARALEAKMPKRA